MAEGHTDAPGVTTLVWLPGCGDATMGLNPMVEPVAGFGEPDGDLESDLSLRSLSRRGRLR